MISNILIGGFIGLGFVFPNTNQHTTQKQLDNITKTV